MEVRLVGRVKQTVVAQRSPTPDFRSRDNVRRVSVRCRRAAGADFGSVETLSRSSCVGGVGSRFAVPCVTAFQCDQAEVWPVSLHARARVRDRRGRGKARDSTEQVGLKCRNDQAKVVNIVQRFDSGMESRVAWR